MVHDLIRHLVTWIYLHPNWAGLALFLLSAGESMTLVGSFIPGTIVMTAVGIFIGADLLPYWPMVLWSACGAIFGDALNFTLGYYLKDNIKNVWPFQTHQHWLKKGQAFLEKHGGKSIFFARFIGPLRAFAPVIAGALHMPASKFYLMDSLSAFTWAITYLLPGVLLGAASLELSPDITEHLFRFVFLTLIVLIVGFWLIRLLILHVNEVVKNALSCLWTKMKESPSFSFICHIFRHHNEDHPRGQLGTLFVSLLILCAFIFLTLFVYMQHPLLIINNNEAHHFVQSLRMQWLDKLMLMITLLGQKEILAVGFLVVLGWLCHQRCWRAAVFWMGAFLLGAGGAYVLKDALHFHRPNETFEAIDGFSYPSGHVVLATIFYGGLTYLGASHRLLRFRWIGYSIASFLVAAVACSRTFLGVHWLSDILGSILLGWLCLLLMALFYQRHPNQNIQPEKMLPCLVVLQVLLTWGYFYTHYSKLYDEYFSTPVTQTIETNTWWQQGAPISMVATNRFGLPKESLNIQWASNTNDITKLLQSQGWRSALEPHNWVLEIQHPEDKIPTINLHLKTRFFDDAKPKLIFYKALNNTPENYMVLQLWATETAFASSTVKIFAGELSINSVDEESQVKLSDAQLTTEFLHSLDNKVKITNITQNNASIILIRDIK